MAGQLLGSLVRYKLAADDAFVANRRRTRPTPDGKGSVVHLGNTVKAGEVYPLLITRVWSEEAGTVNGQVFLDGNDTLWVTSRERTSAVEPTEGRWAW